MVGCSFANFNFLLNQISKLTIAVVVCTALKNGIKTSQNS